MGATIQPAEEEVGAILVAWLVRPVALGQVATLVPSQPEGPRGTLLHVLVAPAPVVWVMVGLGVVHMASVVVEVVLVAAQAIMRAEGVAPLTHQWPNLPLPTMITPATDTR